MEGFEVSKFFSELGLFREVPAETKERLAKAARVRSFKAGDLIMQAGEGGDSVFLVVEGTVSVTLESPKGPAELSTLQCGDVVGEIAMLTKVKRTATITAQSDCVLVQLLAKDLLPLAERYPDLKQQLTGKAIKRQKQRFSKLIGD